ncbi:MAG: hypothetical protein OEU36_13555 [Gammaproteobacteria bacterium]|nr:hypothetical protein [Gammaproteobacteria bacterium]
MQRLTLLANSCVIAALFTSTLTLAQTAEKLQVFDLQVQARTLVNVEQTMRVTQGDSIELRWSTDEPFTIHIHGYDIKQSISVDGITRTNFKAYATGRYPITTHGFGEHAQKHHETLLYLEVHPR